MDVADLVHASSLVRFLRRHRWLHFVLLGSLLFAGTREGDPEEPRRVVAVPEARLRAAVAEMERVLDRPATADEVRNTARALADHEVLLAYALDLGLGSEPVTERRLAQIAQFLSDNPLREGDEPTALAETAAELGLREHDLVTRRILIDGARRLIRAGALLQEPSDEMLDEYLRSHSEEFALDAQIRFTQIAFRGADREARAQAALDRLRREGTPVDAASGLGDPSSVPNDLPSLTDRDIERRFGKRFATQLREIPAGAWSEPLTSRSGVHLVYVHERTDGHVPPLEDVREAVRGKVRQKLADEWLALRLEALRAEYAVVAPTLSGAQVQ